MKRNEGKEDMVRERKREGKVIGEEKGEEGRRRVRGGGREKGKSVG